MTDETSTSPVPVAPIKSAPVRSAPFRRNRGGRAAPEPADTAAGTEPTPEETSGVRETDEPAVDDVGAMTEIGYRQRRQARVKARDERLAAKSTGRVAYRGRDSSGARRIVAAALAVVVIIAAVVTSVVFTVGINRQDQRTALRNGYSEFAKQVIVNLTSLNPTNTDQALKTLQDETSGRAQQQMQDSMKQATGLIRDQKIVTKTTILSDAVTKADPDEGAVIVVYGWEMNAPGQQTTVQTFRWRVDITRINGDLKMTNFEWVT